MYRTLDPKNINKIKYGGSVIRIYRARKSCRLSLQNYLPMCYVEAISEWVSVRDKRNLNYLSYSYNQVKLFATFYFTI